MPSADFCAGFSKPYGPLSPDFEAATQISWGKFNCFRRTPAGYTAMVLDGYGLRDGQLTRPATAASYPVPVRQAAASLHASSGPRLAATPLRFTSLHHHQVGRGLSPHELLNMPARCRAAPNGAKKMMNSKTCQPGLRGQRNSDVENRSGPAPFKPYCAQGLRGRKIDKAKVRGFPSGCGLYFSNAHPIPEAE